MERRLNKLATTILKPVFKEMGYVNGRLILEWSFIVGGEIARIATINKVNIANSKNLKGYLELSCSSSDSLLLSYKQAYILQKVNQFLGFNGVHKLRFVQLRKKISKNIYPIKLNKSTKDLPKIIEDKLGMLNSDNLQQSLKSMAQYIYAE